MIPFPSPAAARQALLSHLGNPIVENLIFSEATIAELAGGLTAHAPALIELKSGQSIAVPAPGQVLDNQGNPSPAKWNTVREIWEAPARDAERALFKNLPVAPKAIDKLIEKRLADKPIARITHLASAPGSSFPAQLQAAGWWRRLASLALLYTAADIAGLLGFALLGRAAFTGRWDEGWFWGWVALLAISLPLQAASSWIQGWLAIAFGGLMKQRLLAGSLAIDVDKIRTQGVGELLSRVLESEAVENLALGGGTQTILAILELIVAAYVLTLGAAPMLCLSLFLAWGTAVTIATALYARRRGAWMRSRNSLTEKLIEKMNGHRTRIAQQPAPLWHTAEDADLFAYNRVAERMDSLHAALTAVGPRGWLALGMAAVGLEFARGQATTEAVAIATGGVLLGYQALRHFAFGLGQCAGAWQAWELIKDLFRAAGDEKPAPPEQSIAPSGKVLEVRDLSYAYPRNDRKVLANCAMEIRPGDRILLEGSSGSGKSTFGNILAGLRPASGGLLLAQGLDPATVGHQAWRRRVATAPQYHENHIMAAPLQFNLLMGRNWPLAPGDAEAAWDVCQELGLGPLLDRMPAGIMEMVGDTGWQLSQGERSRVYIARAILQNAPLVILDESFAALDPETLETCLNCVLRRAPSLMVIAHP